MAIPKLSSQELINIMKNAQQKITDIDTKVDTMKSDISKKLQIMRYETEYVNSMMTRLQAGQYTQSADMSILTNVDTGKFDTYGAVVHSQFITEPTNVFNLKVAGTGEVFFRTDVKVSVNGVQQDKYADVLKHDSLSKEIFFDEYTSNQVTISIALDDTSKLLGPTKFNTIEFDSFLNGSYDIQKLLIYKINSDGTYSDTPDEYAYPSVGKLRVILSSKVSFYKVDIVAKLNFSTTKNGKVIYPFGLKHIYFYNADYNTDSYAIVPITRSSTIAIIEDAIKIKDVAGTRTSTIEEEDIEVYLDYSSGVLDTQVYPSTSTQRNEIARSVKTLYAKVPLASKALIGIAFTVETR